jgi:hypothetical protein
MLPDGLFDMQDILGSTFFRGDFCSGSLVYLDNIQWSHFKGIKADVF